MSLRLIASYLMTGLAMQCAAWRGVLHMVCHGCAEYALLPFI